MGAKRIFRLAIALLLLLALALTGTARYAGASPAFDKVGPESPNLILSVNDLGDQGDATPGDGVCETVADNSVCTLRAAIDESNATPVQDIVTFNLPGAAPYTINTSGYQVTRSLIVNGSGAATDAGQPRIIIAGPGSGDGFKFNDNAAGSWINGLHIRGFGFAIYVHADGVTVGSNMNDNNDLKERCVLVGNTYGILVAKSAADPVEDTLIANNWIGTADGTSATPNTLAGILLDSSRGAELAQNLISGQTGGYGVYVATGSDHNWFWGNKIGVNAASTAGLSNKRGIYIHDSIEGGAPDLNRIGFDPGSSVSALAQKNIISGNPEYNVAISGPGANGNIVWGNWIGPLNLTSKYLPSKRGLLIDDRAAYNRIVRNVIGGTATSNPAAGIELIGTRFTVIQANIIGMMPDGLTPAPNKYGIYLNAGTYRSTIGTDSDGVDDIFEGNSISGNNLGSLAVEGYGIYAVGIHTTQNIIAGNRIGLAAAANTALGNKWGVYFDADAMGNRIGSNMDGTQDDVERNIIAYNSSGGVAVKESFQNSVVGNSIYGNVGLGIDLEADGVTHNDDNDPDSGGNRLQNKALISSTTLVGTQLQVSFKVETAATNADYPLHVDLYKAEASGQGHTWIGRLDYTAGDAQTTVTRSFTPGGPVTISVADQIVAVVSDNLGNSSEFSALSTIASPPTPTPTKTSTVAPTATKTSTVAATATSTATSPAATATTMATSCGMSFSDVKQADYFYQPVLYLACQGTISGYADGTFRPFNNTTRGQLAKIVVGAQGWAINTTGAPHFGDVDSSNPFYSQIETAYNRGVINGYADGSFKPFNNVTRGQLSKIVVKAQGWALLNPATPTFEDVATSNPFYQEIETAVEHGIISGYDLAGGGKEFRWTNNATRGQIAKIVYLAATSTAQLSAAKEAPAARK